MRPAKTKKFSQLLLTNMLLVATISCVLIGCLWVVQETLRFNADVTFVRARMINSRRELMKERVDRGAAYIEFMHRQTDEYTRRIIKERVYEAHRIATHLYDRYKEIKSRPELEEMVREALRPIRFNNGRGYFFATRLDGVEQLCATCSQLENSNLIDMQDQNGAYVIRDMIELVRKNDEGYTSYTWTKPDTAGHGHIKISFVKLFQPFQWFLGAGEYVSDVEEDLKQEALRWIREIRFGEDGYIFAGQWDGTSLSGPSIGKNMIGVADQNGVKIVEEMINVAQNDGGFVDYVMPKLEGYRPEPKISYAKGIPAWQWYIGTGMYIDDIEDDIAVYRQQSVVNLYRNIAKIGISMVFIWLGVLALVTRLNRKTKSMLTAFSRFFNRESDDQTEIDLESLSVQEFKDLAGSANRMIAERRAATEALREKSEELERYFSLSLDLLCIANTKGEFVRLNPEWEKVLGYPVADLIGQSFLELVHPDDLEATKNTLSSLDDQQDVLNFENRYRCADGSYRWIEWRSRPKGSLVYATARDVTDQKKAEVEREYLQAQLIHAQKMEAIGTLAGGIAHDFNNILGAILGYAEMAYEDSLSGSVKPSDLNQVLHASHRAKDLVKQILAFSRQEQAHKIPMRPAAMVKESIKLLRSSIPTTIDIQQDIDSETDLILADPTHIHQIMMNLCTNAYHAMEQKGGTLSISLKTRVVAPQDLESFPDIQPGHFVQLSIKDTGSGIAPEIQARIFDPYYTTKEVGKGTGMGLSIVHGIAKSYGGFITCHSEIGAGTVFEIYLPAISEQIEPESKEIEMITVGTEHILFVDDEKMLAEMGKTMLERLGYRVTATTSSADALTILQEQPAEFDLVITDQTMPGMTGSDLAQCILQIRPGMPIILCTGFSNSISEEKARIYGIQGFAMKPLAQKDLAVLIRKVLDVEKI